MTKSKIWYEITRFFSVRKRPRSIWSMLVMAVVLFLACLVIGMLLHLLIDAFSNDTVSGMQL